MGNSIKGGRGGKEQSQNNNGIIYHFLYIYMDDDNNDELSSITNLLLSIVGPNISELKNNGIYVEVFQLDKHTLKNKELIKLLKKNGILKLPVLKIHNGSENANALIIGANQIIEYYNKYLGLTIPVQRAPPMQKAQQSAKLQSVRGYPPSNSSNPSKPSRPLTKASIIEEDDDEDLPIGSNKNMTSKLDEMIKFRELSKQGYKNNARRGNSDNSSDNGSSRNGSSRNGSSRNGSSRDGSSRDGGSSRNVETSKKKYTTVSITKEDLLDSPFREGEFLDGDLDDGLDNNLDDNMSSYTSSLLSSKSNSKNNIYSNMGDDEADDEKDELMVRAFWDNNLNT
jgi:hypothetical protein